MNHMNVEDIDVRITMFPRGDEDDGSVVLVGNRSKKAWLREMEEPSFHAASAAESVMLAIDFLEKLGVYPGVESIEVKVKKGHGHSFVIRHDDDNGGAIGYTFKD